MPHIRIEYSSNLEDRLDMAGFCAVLRDAAAETGLFPRAGIRVRAIRCDHVLIADGNPAHAFADISVRLRAGRPLDARKAATDAIFAAARGFCAPVLDGSSFMLSMEMRDIDAALSPKDSSIRRYLPDDMR